MTSLEAAGLWVGLNMLLLIFLSARVGVARNKHKVNLGDGDNPDMLKAIRAQGNYVEYAPAALGGLVLLALLGVSVVFVHVIGAVFFLARIFHLMGLGTGVWPKGRTVGTAMTMLSLLITGVVLVFLAVF